MRPIFTLLFLLLYVSKSYSQKTSTSTNITFDTLKIDNLYFPVYKSWQELISKQLRFDKQYPRNGQKFFGNKDGIIYEVKNPDVNLQKYNSPNVYFWLGGKEAFKLFFKNAPVKGFNPTIVAKDTVMLSFFYLIKKNKDENAAIFYNKNIQKQVVEAAAEEHNIKLSVSTNIEDLKLQQQKIKSLYDSCYLFADTTGFSSNSKSTTMAYYNETEKMYSIVFWKTTSFKIGTSDIALQCVFMASKYKTFSKVKMNMSERKKWYEYFLPVVKNAFYKEGD